MDEPRKWLKQVPLLILYEKKEYYARELAKKYGLSKGEAERIVGEYLESKRKVLEKLVEAKQKKIVVRGRNAKLTDIILESRRKTLSAIALKKKPVDDTEDYEVASLPTTSIVKTIQLTPISLFYIYLLKDKSLDEARRIVYKAYIKALREGRLKVLGTFGAPVKEVIDLLGEYVDEDFRVFYLKYYRRELVV